MNRDRDQDGKGKGSSKGREQDGRAGKPLDQQPERKDPFDEADNAKAE
jgi:hypothetical protein